MRMSMQNKEELSRWLDSSFSFFKVGNILFSRHKNGIQLFANEKPIGMRKCKSAICRLAEKYYRYNTKSGKTGINESLDKMAKGGKNAGVS